jgi:hypothetical protein
MALKKQENIEVRLVGQVQITSYVRVSHITGTKNEITANAVFHKDNGDGEMFKAGAYTFKPSMDDGNFIKQAYEHLKTLPEFSGAEDC